MHNMYRVLFDKQYDTMCNPWIPEKTPSKYSSALSLAHLTNNSFGDPYTTFSLRLSSSSGIPEILLSVRSTKISFRKMNLLNRRFARLLSFDHSDRAVVSRALLELTTKQV